MTNNNLLILLLSTIILGQYCHQTKSQTVDKSNNSAEDSNEWPSDLYNWPQMRTMPASFRMKNSIFHICMPLFNFTLVEGANIFECVLKDMAALETPTASLQSKLAQLSEFIALKEGIKQTKHADKTLDLLEVATYFKYIVDKYNTNGLWEPTAEDVLIKVALKKHSSQFRTEFDRMYLEIAPQIYKKADKYFGSLSAKDRRKDEVLIRKYEALKNAQEVDERRHCFAEFILAK